jgi:hypothetical protein
MLTTAGEARDTASAKLKMGGVRAPPPDAAAAAGASGPVAGGNVAAAGVCRVVVAPSNAGFHHTRMNAAARPTITARNRKFTMSLARRNYSAPDDVRAGLAICV